MGFAQTQEGFVNQKIFPPTLQLADLPQDGGGMTARVACNRPDG
jgi:hypothetical protein